MRAAGLKSWDRTLRRALTAAAAVAFCHAPLPAAAQDPSPTQPPRRIELRHDLAIDVTATAVMAVGLVTWGFVKKDAVGTTTCTICDGRKPGDVNAIDDFFRSMRSDDTKTAGTISDIGGYALAPAFGATFTIVAASRANRLDEAPLNGLLAVEATLAASVVQQGLSALIRRERPQVHDGSIEERSAGFRGSSLESFPGGHTMLVMAATASTATIATLRGYRLAPLIWVTGSILAATVSYLRIAADRHYFTDNLAGAAIGLGIGAGIPLVFHGRRARPWYQPTMLGTSPVRDGRVVDVTWVF